LMLANLCNEHNFILQSINTDMWRSKQQCSITCLSLTKAFESVQDTIFAPLQWAGLDVGAIDVSRCPYPAKTTAVCSSQRQTLETAKCTGVKQGWLLSPRVFNLAMDPILRATTPTAVLV
jgi:hypothetical protein